MHIESTIPPPDEPAVSPVMRLRSRPVEACSEYIHEQLSSVGPLSNTFVDDVINELGDTVDRIGLARAFSLHTIKGDNITAEVRMERRQIKFQILQALQKGRPMKGIQRENQ